MDYVDNKKLYQEMVIYIGQCNEAKERGEPKRPRVSEYIGECIYLICTRLATKPNFVGYSYKEEMIGDGIENCMLYLHNFNQEKSKNPFAYFTQIAFYAFLRRIAKEKKHTYTKHKNFENTVLAAMLEQDSDDTAEYSNLLVNVDSKISDLIERFESDKLKKKQKKAGVEDFYEADRTSSDSG